jgi:deoxyribose-phosphate aldolase
MTPLKAINKSKKNMTDSIAKLIDHAILHPTLTDQQIVAGCELAKQLSVASVCVKPYTVELAAKTLRDCDVGVGTVIGFPHGSNSTEIKVAESNWALDRGATELDMVVNIGKVRQADWDFVQKDIAAVVNAGHNRNAIVKVIFETDFVTEREDKIKLCHICEAVAADFVKTSTGFGFVKGPDGNYNYAGASVSDVILMRETCSPNVQVKASGGIRSYEDATRFRDLGCTRLGTSASAAIVEGQGVDVTSY